MSHVVELLTADAPSSAMTSHVEVRAIPGVGILGDRYHQGVGTFSPHPQKPDHEITFIEQEAVDAFVRDSGIAFTARDARRNVVTHGVDLNALVGKEFSVGSVRIRGVRLCEPCSYLAKKTSPQTLYGLVHKGGLRAQILSEGVLKVGDLITALR